MWAIVIGSLFISLAALMAARSLASLGGLTSAPVQQLALPLMVWLTLFGLLALLIPETGLIEQQHRLTLGLSLAAVTLVCLAPLPVFWRRNRAS